MAIPPFDENGNLPGGIWEATIEEVKERYAVGGIRKRLFEGLLKVIPILQNGGCKVIYLDGSFVTSKELTPSSDYDACIRVDEANDELKKHLFPTPGDMGHCVSEQKRLYRGEFRYANMPESFDWRTRKYVTMLDYFQYDPRTQKAKGIIKIDL